MSNYKPNPDKNVNLFIDGFPVTVPEGTTILEAARKINVNIPTLCNHKDLCRRGLCRMCVVECDGRGKLVASCVTDVWEGVKVVTNNLRILGIRKTIMELLLANHPPECLICVKHQTCELQDLSLVYNVSESLFEQNYLDPKTRKVSDDTLVIDMRKCIKCGRCVDACQEIQTVKAINTAGRSREYEICTPYKQPLHNGPCTYCGHCAKVCPVGAIYSHDQSRLILEKLGRKDMQKAAQVSKAAAIAIAKEAGLEPQSINTGNICAALKAIGFGKVYDADFFTDLAENKKYAELLERIKKGGKLPMIAGCSAGLVNFMKEYYPDLLENMSAGITCEHSFREMIQTEASFAQDTNPSLITTVTLAPCLAQKYTANYALLPKEFLQILQIKGIDLASMEEAPFDSLPKDISNRYELQNSETKAKIAETGIKTLTLTGLADARPVFESIRRGECSAGFVDVRFCSECDRE
ncbi:MAG: 2Fe-2S iron-sulfur cluster-binding protein [Treponema sp.]|nr:2Fe-2S iron-sulfur cluster-binding protein [Treponema sp.]